jgi:hypothetical protein
MPAQRGHRSENLEWWSIDDFIKSWFMPFSATYRERRGTEPDNLFQMLSKHSGEDGRPFGVYRYVIETRKALAH